MPRARSDAHPVQVSIGRGGDAGPRTFFSSANEGPPQQSKPVARQAVGVTLSPVRAKTDYQPSLPGYLRFCKGTIILQTGVADQRTGMATGILDGDIGTFPDYKVDALIPGFETVTLTQPVLAREWLRLSQSSKASREILLAFLRDGVDVNLRDNHGSTALHHILHLPKTDDLVLVLIDAGADVFAENHAGLTPLHLTEYMFSKNVASVLVLSAGKNPAFEKWGHLALCIAAFYDLREVAGTMLRSGADVNGHQLQNITPIMVAVRHGHVRTVQTLLEHGADPNVVWSETKQTLLHLASNQFEVTKLLLQAGANVKVFDADQNTPLHNAIQLECVKVARFLLLACVDTQAIGWLNTLYLLHLAVDRASVDLVRLLLSVGIDANVSNAAGHTALDHAIKLNSKDYGNQKSVIIALLIKQHQLSGNPPRKISGPDNDLLKNALTNEDFPTFKGLLAGGLDPQKGADTFVDLVDLVITKSLYEEPFLEELLKAGAREISRYEVNDVFRGIKGRSTLPLTKILLDYGAEQNELLVDAISKDKVEAVQYLLSKGAKPSGPYFILSRSLINAYVRRTGDKIGGSKLKKFLPWRERW